VTAPPGPVADDWPRSVLKLRVDGARGPAAAEVISAVDGIVGARPWSVSTHETRETWLVLHFPAGRGRAGEPLPPDQDRAALDDVLRVVGAAETVSVIKRRAFVVLLDDEEVGRVADGRPSRELVRDVLDPWRHAVTG
jgi:hypothetical protein